ncbi:WD-40 repeat protein, partial [Reticulomyxa filosa]
IKLGWIDDFDKIIFKYSIMFTNQIYPYIVLKKKVQIFSIYVSKDNVKRKNKKIKKMTTSDNEKQRSKEEEVQTIIQYWIRTLNIKLGWIHDLEKLVANYATTVFIIDTFCSSSKLLKTLTGHTSYVYSIDHSTFDGGQFICSGSGDKTARVWDVDNNKQIQLFNGHSSYVYCVRFSKYHYHNYRQNIILFNEHTSWINVIEFSSFNGGRYLCSGSGDKTIRLWDVETSKSLHVFNGHESIVHCVDTSPLQSNNNNNESNSIGVIGGNGYTICSGSYDTTIRIWDIETTKQFIVFRGHKGIVSGVKYGSNEIGINCSPYTILSGSDDKSVRLWDIRSEQQIQVFNGHTGSVHAVEYSPFVIKDSNEGIDDISNVICSGSGDNTIRFWDIRSNKKELYLIKGDNGIRSLTFMPLKKKINNNEQKLSDAHGIHLCYGSYNGLIRVWG